ncbi:RINT1-like protein MAG2 [Prosopis cineraria]|uniref:RINT1-like protein MAG2 n=1 Tax=Prosopis cineraria TaxID=364024 RepID=UPI00240EB1AE|nr:RINT1-like protein MAG2 [Prosopis cineraria]
MNEEDMESVQILPLPSDLSPSALTFLNAKFHTKGSVAEAPSLVSELQTQCCDLDQALVELNRRLGAGIVAYSSFSGQIHDLFSDINAKLTAFTSSCSSTVISDGPSGEKNFREELPALAKEVARLETVRVYAETALKLDSLVGDIEDAVSYTMNKNLRKHSSAQNSEEMHLLAIKTLKMTEEVLTTITKTHPQWKHLVSAVDHRVDRALAILRPQAIADYRALLASLGWPPRLSSFTSDSRSVNEVSNPLLSMKADLKVKYSENFLALCSLQELQRQRKARQLEGHDLKVAQHQPLWAIEELVNPISLASQQHFSKWVNKPEFIFTLAYKISRDYVDSMDELLQPLVDEAKLVGYSCREEWISAMVTSLSTYLAKEIFPVYISQLEEENATPSSTLSATRISWLHLIDLMISFDKRIKSLVEHSGISLSFEEDGILQQISSFSVFCDRPDWLDLWAEIELNDALDKLKSVTDEEKNWRKQIEGVVLSSCTDDYKSPLVSNAFLRHLASLIDRCRSLPSVALRSRFLKLAAVPIIRNFFDCILIRCQEAEGLTALTDDDALVKVAISVNAACYFESVLREWSEDVFFLEMGTDWDDKFELSINPDRVNEGLSESPQISTFDEDIKKLEEFRIEWVEKISLVILRGFDARSREYVKNRRQWQNNEDGWTISKTLIEALDYLQGKMSVVEKGLNSRDFVRAWRSLAAGIDQLIFTRILISNVKFHNGGVERFGNDLGVIFGVFGAWCLRLEGFFQKASEGLKLLKMEENSVHECLAGGKNWLKENGIRHLSVTDVEKIMKSRVFAS